MNVKTAVATALTATGLLAGIPLSAGANAGGMAAHEKVLDSPGGLSTTVGQMNTAFRPVAPMNGMPTDREVYLDNTAYGSVTGGTGKIRTGYFVACAVDLDVKFTITADVGIDLDASAGVSVGILGVEPSASVDIRPTIGASIGLDMGITAGKITEIKLGEKALLGGGAGYIVNRDYHLTVSGCGGQLTIKSYTVIEATSASTDAADWVIGDPIIL